jgi:hypothetical protein
MRSRSISQQAASRAEPSLATEVVPRQHNTLNKIKQDARLQSRW